MSEWIKCTDRLPEIDKYVLCYVASNFPEQRFRILKLYIYQWSQKGIIKSMPMFSEGHRSWNVQDISHWCELPEVPNE